NHTRTRFEPNLHTKRIWIEEEKCWVKVKLSAKAMKIISKTGTAKLAALLK
ncbi:MAG: 50S ribosomal protein L28, partial [Chlorobium limicola]|nr:50S ribosomal protein L28 [Chlorobium limicola]